MSKTLLAVFVSVFAFFGGLSTLFAQSLSSRAEPSTGVLPRSLVGNAIEDGVGYGGIRIGSPESELLSKWGTPAQVTPGGTEKTYVYLLEGSGEFVSVPVKNGNVEAIGLILMKAQMSSLRTTKGIRLGSPFAEVRKAYGNPELQDGREITYASQGIGFRQEAGLVAMIVIFQPGRSPK